VTKVKRAWCKANAHVRSGQHEKALYWLSRTLAILDGEPPRRRRGDGMNECELCSRRACCLDRARDRHGVQSALAISRQPPSQIPRAQKVRRGRPAGGNTVPVTPGGWEKEMPDARWLEVKQPNPLCG
jgi:hypothetical protein